jgi:hypothetical protein
MHGGGREGLGYRFIIVVRLGRVRVRVRERRTFVKGKGESDPNTMPSFNAATIASEAPILCGVTV